MDYKSMKTGGSASKKAMWVIILLLTGIIIAQCVIGLSLWLLNNHYKAMFEEALYGKIELQHEVNDVKEEYERLQNKSGPVEIELPYVTGSETEESDESSITDQ